MLRFVINERGQPSLPAVDVDAPVVVIGSAATATIRLPAAAARPEHVRIEGTRWQALGAVGVDGTPRAADAAGDLAATTIFEVGAYRVEVTRAPAGAPASPPQRTESLARELMRGLLGDGAEPTLTIERGPNAGARRVLPPPEARLVIGRGDDADWVILDEDLSRRHAEIRRSWEGTLLADLGSQNGTRVHGEPVTDPVLLRDGARIALGNLVLLYTDPAERRLATPAHPLPAAAPPPAARPLAPFVVAVAVAAAALAGLAWVLAS